MLHSDAGGEEGKGQAKKRRRGAQQRCEDLVANLMELLLTEEEARAAAAARESGVTSESRSAEERLQAQADREDAADRIVATIGTVAVFCEVRCSYIKWHSF